MMVQQKRKKIVGCITAEQFRSIVYPKLLQKIESTEGEYIKAGIYSPNEAKQKTEEELNELNELYHLSD